jgi:hypothetical protein
MEAEYFVETLLVMLPVYQNRLRHISAFVCVYIHRTDRQTVMWYKLMTTKFVTSEETLERDFSKILAETILGILNFIFLSPRFVQSRRHNGQLDGWKDTMLQRIGDFSVSPVMCHGDNSDKDRTAASEMKRQRRDEIGPLLCTGMWLRVVCRSVPTSYRNFCFLSHPDEPRGVTPHKILGSVFPTLNLRQRRDVGRSRSHHGCVVLQLDRYLCSENGRIRLPPRW